MRTNGTKGTRRRILWGAGIFALSLASLYTIQQTWLNSPRLLSVQEIPDVGDSCYRPSDDGLPNGPAAKNLFTAFEAPTVYAQDANTTEQSRQPVRTVWDTDPVFSSVGVDPVRDEVYLQDSNKWTIRVYGRTENAKPGQGAMEPRRMIGGPKSDVQFNSCVWVDPGAGTSTPWKTTPATRSSCSTTRLAEIPTRFAS